MNKLIYTWILLILSLLTQTVRAYELGDYAYGISIDNPKKAPIVQFSVPKTVYEHVLNEDMDDVGVYDISGNKVPFQIFPSMPMTNIARKKIAFFPVYGKSNQISDFSIRLLKQVDGAKVEVISDRVKDSDAPLIGYVIPLEKLSNLHIKSLELFWKKQSDNWLAEMSIEVSQDLKHWKPITHHNMSVANLDYDGNILQRNILPIDRTVKDKYLLLRWGEDSPNIDLEKISAVINETKMPSDIQSFTVSPSKRPESGSLEYQLDGNFPVMQLNLVFDSPNRLLNAKFYSKNHKDMANWQYRTSGFFYLLDKNQQIFTNDPVMVSRDADQYWKVELVGKGSIVHPYPKLVAYWVADTIVFIAEGEGPYTLAFGSAKITTSGSDYAVNKYLSKTDQNYHDLPKAALGSMHEIGGEKALKSTLEWRTIALWAILIIGVMLVFLMVFLLRSEMKSR